MSRNGNGTYNLPAGNPVTSGSVISSAWSNSTLSDIAAALTGSVASDGQTPVTGNLNMSGNKISNLGAGTLSTDAANLTQVTSAVAITGGTINNTPIGQTTAALGSFTNLSASGSLAVAGSATFTSTGAVKIPVGTTAQQPTPATGQIRYNTTVNQYEGYGASAWIPLGTGAAGSNTQVQFNSSNALAGSSGLTFNGTTLQATAIQTDTLNSTSGVLATQNGITGISKSWLNYNGSTQTVLSSFNVSSVTRSSTGIFVVNFTTAMPSANFSALASANLQGGTTWISVSRDSAKTTTTVQLTCVNESLFADLTDISLAVFSS
jgi:hypothetical protein